jgi:hypothetical protein
MKILVIIATHRMAINLKRNIIRLDFLLRAEGHNVEYAGISSIDDFANYEDIIKFKYKEINTKYQLTKVCDFIQKHQKHLLNYDWFIRLRTEMFLLEPLSFKSLCTMSINARARKYVGPKSIQYGMSTDLPSSASEIESFVEVDDQIYIFHKNVIDKGGFAGIESYNNKITIENETVHTEFWDLRGISFNIIPINALFIRDPCWIGYQSGHLNYPSTQ